MRNIRSDAIGLVMILGISHPALADEPGNPSGPDENGVWELEVIDTDKDGKNNLAFIDENEDKKYDVRAYDYDQDGNWDKFEKLS